MAQKAGLALTDKRSRGITRPRRQPSPELGARLEESLEANDMTRSALAEELGLSQGYVSKLVSGKEAPPSEPVMREIAELLGENADSLLFTAKMLPRWMELALLELDPELVADAIRRMQNGELEL